MTELADKIESGEEAELVDAVAARLPCDCCGNGPGECECIGGPYARPGAMFGALLDEVAERRAAGVSVLSQDAPKEME